MFKIFNKTNSSIFVCGEKILAHESSKMLENSYYEGNKSKVDNMIRLGLVSKLDLPEIDEDAYRQEQHQIAEELLRRQEAETRRIQEEIIRQEQEIKKQSEEAKKQAEVKKKTEPKKIEIKKEETKKTVKKEEAKVEA